jgi:hypothetical protein
MRYTTGRAQEYQPIWHAQIQAFLHDLRREWLADNPAVPCVPSGWRADLQELIAEVSGLNNPVH